MRRIDRIFVEVVGYGKRRPSKCGAEINDIGLLSPYRDREMLSTLHVLCGRTRLTAAVRVWPASRQLPTHRHFHSPEIGDPKLPFEVADWRAAQSAYAVHRRHLPVWETSWAAHDRAVGGSCDMIAMFHGAMGGEDDAN